MFVKICGVTNLDDALAAADAGADMLGFNFYDLSPRHIEPDACAAIVRAFRQRGAAVQAVGVFVNAGLAEIIRVAALCNLDQVQLHGDEPPELLATLRAQGATAFKAIRPATPEGAAELFARYACAATESAPGLLVDAFRPGTYGGAGRTGDWALAAGLARRAPILLAGGLTPDNVGQAVAQVRPWGVDAASGVESSPGRKDYARMAAFVAAARQGE